MSNRTLQALLGTFIAAVAILTIAIFVIPWGESDIVLDTARFRPEGGHAYIIDVPRERRFLAFRSDSANWPDQSDLLLLENGRPLGPAHALHQFVRNKGRGAYSHWDGALRFSASDNSDPRSNGRTYQVWAPLALAPMVIYALFTLDGLAVLAILALGYVRGWRIEDVRATAARFSLLLTKQTGPLSRLLDSFGIGLGSTARQWQHWVFGLVTVILAIIINLTMLKYTDFRPCLEPDSGSYLDFSLVRTGGYPAIVLGIHALTGDVRWMVPFQLNLLLLSLAWLGYSVGRLAGTIWLGLLLTLLCFATVPLLLLTYQILTEATFTAFIALHCAFVANYLRTRRWEHAVAAGTMLVIVILIRPAGYSLLLGIPLVAWLVTTDRFRSMLQLGIPVVAGLVLASLVNYTQFGVFSTQSFGGYSILGHTLFLLEPEDGASTEIAPMIREIANEVAPLGRPVRDAQFPKEAWLRTMNLYNELLWGRTVPKLVKLLGESAPSLTGVELGKRINDLGFRIALIAIRAHPYEYARHVLANYYGMWSGLLLDYGSFGAHVANCYAETRAIVKLPRNKIFTRFTDPAYFLDPQTSARVQAHVGDRHWLQSVYQAILILRPFILVAGLIFSAGFAVAGLMRTTTSLACFACYLSLQLNGYFFFVAGVQAALERYSVPLTPVLWAIVFLGTVVVVRSAASARMARWMSRGRARRRLTAGEGSTSSGHSSRAEFCELMNEDCGRGSEGRRERS
jgi:hypothetical protein